MAIANQSTVKPYRSQWRFFVKTIVTCLTFFAILKTQPAYSRTSCEDLFTTKLVNSFGFDANTLLDRVPAVHVTKYMPTNGVVRAGDGPKTFRPEVHFALGEVVRSHPDGLWEHMPYAVVTNLRRLEPQLLNIMTYDTSIIGDFKLGKSDYLVVPEGESKNAPRGVTVVTYNPREKTIRMAVDDLIASLNWFPIRGSDGMGRIHHPAMLGQRNVNLPDFFAPILNRNPHISFGGHGKSNIGQAAVFGLIDLKWLRIQGFDSNPDLYSKSTMNLELDLELALDALKKTDKLAAAYDSKHLGSYQRQRARLILYINLAAADIKLRKTHGRTIVIESPFSEKDLLAQAASPEKLEKFLESVKDKLPQIKPEKPYIGDFTIEAMAHLTPTEFLKFTEKHSAIFDSESKDYATLAYGLERFLIIGLQNARREKLIPLIQSAAISSSTKEPPYFFNEIFKTYFTAEHFGQESSRLTDILQLFTLGEVRSFLASQMDMRLPDHQNLTLTDVLMSHPRTRDAYKPYPQLFSDVRVLMLLKAIPRGGFRGIDYSPLIHDEYGLAASQIRGSSLDSLRGKIGPALPPFFDFKVAEAAAQIRQSVEDPFSTEKHLYESPSQVPEVAKPRGFVTFGESILTGLRHEPEKLEEIWVKLNLRDQFRRRFPTDADFWKSTDSLLEIYFKLLAERN